MYSLHFGKQLADKYAPKESLSETIFTRLVMLGAVVVAVAILALAMQGAT